MVFFPDGRIICAQPALTEINDHNIFDPFIRTLVESYSNQPGPRAVFTVSLFMCLSVCLSICHYLCTFPSVIFLTIYTRLLRTTRNNWHDFSWKQAGIAPFFHRNKSFLTWQLAFYLGLEHAVVTLICHSATHYFPSLCDAENNNSS